ncbi:MAG: zf-HC2 domain-containing protein [Polyangia bacterium]
MSEQCKYDEQVLDYLYGELAEAERAEFANHLATCASCRLEIESLSGVRKKASSLPRPELTSDAAAKMRAQLMEAAIAATKDQKQSLGGGKLIAFPTGRVRRFMTHPATALVTVAAAALFLVVFKGKDQPAPVLDLAASRRQNRSSGQVGTGGGAITDWGNTARDASSGDCRNRRKAERRQNRLASPKLERRRCSRRRDRGKKRNHFPVDADGRRV